MALDEISALKPSSLAVEDGSAPAAGSVAPQCRQIVRPGFTVPPHIQQ
jgi:hypothetical protein